MSWTTGAQSQMRSWMTYDLQKYEKNEIKKQNQSLRINARISDLIDSSSVIIGCANDVNCSISSARVTTVSTSSNTNGDNSGTDALDEGGVEILGADFFFITFAWPLAFPDEDDWLDVLVLTRARLLKKDTPDTSRSGLFLTGLSSRLHGRTRPTDFVRWSTGDAWWIVLRVAAGRDDDRICVSTLFIISL